MQEQAKTVSSDVGKAIHVAYIREKAARLVRTFMADDISERYLMARVEITITKYSYIHNIFLGKKKTTISEFGIK